MEIWKEVKGFEEYYQCSNLGRIRSFPRYYIQKNNLLNYRKSTILQPQKNKNGYLQVSLYKDGVRTMEYVHIIIAKSFIDNYDNLPTVNHIDGNKDNNCMNNLEWCSYSDNNTHSYRSLHRKTSNKGCIKNSFYLVDNLNHTTKYYESVAEAARNIDLSCTQIRRYINSNKQWKGRYMFTTNNDKCVEDIEKIS